MKSIQSRMVLIVSLILITMVATLMITSTMRTNSILDEDSEEILISEADHQANIIDDNFRSTEQSVGTIYNYAVKRAEVYSSFVTDEEQTEKYTYDIAELGKSIAENTRGAMAVYLRYNPDDFGPTGGFWYTIVLEDGSWEPSVPTDMSLYSKDDLEHVGWYYIPIANKEAMWMDPYYNANLGVDMISYIIPYFYDDYTVGIIGMDISMDLLKEAVAQVKVFKSGRAFLMSKNGDLIYHEDYPQGIALEDLSNEDREYFSAMQDMEMDVPRIDIARDGTEQKLILKELKNGMILGIYAPLEEINAPRKSLLHQLSLLSITILVAGILLTLLIVQSIISPLKKMTKVAEEYANGNFDQEMNVHSDDEVGVLSRSLQTMSTSLKEQIELADSANKAKSEFLANMSHEIRTPINAVLGMNEMILREAKDEKIAEYSADIQTAGRTLLSLINSILDFSKIEDGKMEILEVTYDTAGMINGLVNSISERAKAKGLNLVVKVDAELPRSMKGDDVRLSQVIMNLLTNAVKYTEKGEVRFSVSRVKTEGKKADILVEVKDTGIGIREEDMEKLTQTFTRIDEKRNRNIEGTGLGMAIVTRLLDMMGSELKIESVYGLGSSFSFVISQEIADETPIGDYEERVREKYRTRSTDERPQMKDAKVLLVDDYEMNLKVGRNLLNIYGIKPDLVNSGKDAIEAMKRKRYDIVFLDHMMPQMDGIETLKHLKNNNLIKEGTVMIALTANAVVGARESYLEAGFDDYLSKPIELKALGEMLIKHLPEELVKYV